MMIADLMVKGGTIHVVTQEGRLLVGVDENVRIVTEKAEQTKNIINGEQDSFVAQDAPTLYLSELCKNAGQKLSCTISPFVCFAVE